MELEDIVNNLAARSRSSLPGECVVTGDEVRDWPREALASLERDRVLERLAPAQAIECDACPEGHVEVVEFVEEPPGTPSRAYIPCPVAGRVSVDLERLRRWRVRRGEQTPSGSRSGAPSSARAGVALWSLTAGWPPTARSFVEVLREARDAGTPMLDWSEIQKRLNSRRLYPARARDVRRNVPNWHDVVASPRRGFYALRP